ncbi:zeta toxin [Pseudomassariella vexata]|uniref:Zeta toxin n=1 Tax=Pseudomassariella vexata TaxID=1141098 RepID=A0A1Y2EEK6_9PEZI|nr:zeta toxin [Pseudomassariella vexata]ORY69990.1 zeta toxin [Pseudomassariella vexata]
MDPNPQSYILSQSELRAIFERDIVPAELETGKLRTRLATNAETTQRPLAVLVVGQTGAGKTRIAPTIKQAIRSCRGEPAHFIADTYKTYHPAYTRLIVERPALASPATRTDARRWLAMAAAYAVARRIDVLLESACRNPEDFVDLTQAFHEGGYRVEVVIMAVPKGLSRLGILTRFYEKLPEAGSGNLPVRLTPKTVHDDSYEHIFDAAAVADGSVAIDQIVVMRRDNVVAYANERVGSGEWRKRAAAAEAIRTEIGRPLLPTERSIAYEDLDKLRKRKVPELASQVTEIETLLEAILTKANDTDLPSLRPLSLPSGNNETDKVNLDKLDLRLGLYLS